ncbi:hypothetical protein OC842_002517 [Tilletia horrida]|uniref:Granulins domain-containing protein n=1 Tax=Tilletia horrida TaxID=155126 RepID=A0AAN6GDI8_9BASI|nr:hypothetical protein OC842_002517 [Tilletia horrida]
MQPRALLATAVAALATLPHAYANAAEDLNAPVAADILLERGSVDVSPLDAGLPRGMSLLERRQSNMCMAGDYLCSNQIGCCASGYICCGTELCCGAGATCVRIGSGYGCCPQGYQCNNLDGCPVNSSACSQNRNFCCPSNKVCVQRPGDLRLFCSLPRSTGGSTNTNGNANTGSSSNDNTDLLGDVLEAAFDIASKLGSKGKVKASPKVVKGGGKTGSAAAAAHGLAGSALFVVAATSFFVSL